MTPELFLSLCIGLGLSAACGFRVFVPLLVMSAASLNGQLGLAAGFDWLASWPALIALATATLLEILAYYIPWLDNLLDAVATPAAVIAGVLATASTLDDVSPFVRWSLAIIAGGGLAGIIQAGTVGARGVSTATTAGLGNPIVATVELIFSLLLSLAALVWPLLAVVAVIVIGLVLLRIAGRMLFRRNPSQAVTT